MMSSYTSVVEFCKDRGDTPPSRWKYFWSMSIFSILLDKKFSIGLRVWILIGSLLGYINKYLKVRDESLDRAKEQLEKAFTPEIRKMLDEKMKDVK